MRHEGCDAIASVGQSEWGRRIGLKMWLLQDTMLETVVEKQRGQQDDINEIGVLRWVKQGAISESKIRQIV